MTTIEAMTLADDMQERCTQMGDRVGESVNLGKCISAIRSLCQQIDVLSPPVPAEPVEAAPAEDHINAETPTRRGRHPKGPDA